MRQLSDGSNEGFRRNFAREMGLEPRTTPIESPQTNGMAGLVSNKATAVVRQAIQW